MYKIQRYKYYCLTYMINGIIVKVQKNLYLIQENKKEDFYETKLHDERN